jgi:D-alanine-D-alanine ligase
VIPVGVTRDGAFVLERDDPAAFALDPERLPEVRDDGSRVLWPESSLDRELRVRDADGEVRSLGEIDVAFPILHGPFGEDGTIQGFFELLGVPYAGNGVLASAVAMDKHYTKTVLQAAGLAVAPWVPVVESDRDSIVLRERADALGYPQFVKPARAGSSVGVTRVDRAEDLDAALDVAFAEDSRVLIEQGIAGREIEVGVLGPEEAGGLPRVSVAGEIVLTGDGFYDFAAKYLDAPGVDLVCPATLSDAHYEDLVRVARVAFTAIDGAGLARVDVFLTDDGFVVNEINTMPGFTPISMFPRCWQESGLGYPELIDTLIRLAL